MDQSAKEPKRGTIQSFFRSFNVKNRNSTSTIPHETVDAASASATINNEQQDEQISTHLSSSLSSRLLSPSSSN